MRLTENTVFNITFWWGRNAETDVRLSPSAQESPPWEDGREKGHKQGTVVGVQGWSGPGSDKQISAAPAWQPQGTPEKKALPFTEGSCGVGLTTAMGHILCPPWEAPSVVFAASLC